MQKISNAQVVAELKEVLAAMEVKNVNRFRIRAYQNAISSIEGMTISLRDVANRNKLHEIPGVGSALAQHITELLETGEVKEFEAIKQDLPQGMFELIGLRGIGAKKAYKLAEKFELSSRERAIEQIKIAAEKNEIQQLDGFGEKSEKDILESIEDLKLTKSEKQRMLLIDAESIALRVISYMQLHPAVQKIDALGSLRRRQPTVGDIDLVVATDDPDAVINHFVKFEEIEDVLNKGDKKAVIVLKNDAQVDLRVSVPAQYGAMLQYNTGSKMHNVALRTHALQMGCSLSEYGIKYKDKIEEFDNEKDFYKRIGLPYIVPELRQNGSEVELAQQNKLPKLVGLSDIKGDLHTHTDFSDGVNTLLEMVSAAQEKNYEYLAITDHAPSVSSRGEKEVQNIIDTQKQRIEQLNNSDSSLHVLFGYEVNILADATLGMSDEYLSQLDIVIASIHTSFDQDKKQITKRLLNAVTNPNVNILGHPTGRLINERDSIDADWLEVFDACYENNVMLEINAQPSRLDLPEDLVVEALKKGLKFIINTDSHSADSLNMMQYGIDVARRSGCEKESITNTLPKADFLRLLG